MMRNVAKVVGAVSVCLLFYRGTVYYFRNNVTITVTEVVELPPCGAGPNYATGPFPVQGTVEVETSVMRSYRFLLKLAASVRSAEQSGGSVGRKGHRVMSMAESVTDSFGDYGYSPQYSQSSFTGGAGSSSGERKKGGPIVFVENVNCMVDRYELETTGNICFTPACIADDVLLRYRSTAALSPLVQSSFQPSTVESTTEETAGDPSSTVHRSAREGTTPLLINNGGDYIGSVVVRSAYLEADKAIAGASRLTMEVEFATVAHGVKMFINLPHKRNRIVKWSTSRLGRIIPPSKEKPRQCVWEIGTVDEHTWKTVEGAAPPHEAFTGAEMGSGEGATGVPSALLTCQFSLVYEPIEYQVRPYYDGDSMSYGSEEGGVCSDEDDEEEGDEFSASVRASVKASKSTVSSKSRKRSERAQKKQESVRKVKEGGEKAVTASKNRSGAWVPDTIPRVELTYSLNGLSSGLSIKKLQVVSDKPNWVPRSMFDRVVLRRVMPGLEELKLQKYAHYVSWFLQPVAVTQL